MNWIFEGLTGWIADAGGEWISRSRRPWIVGLVLVMSLLLIATLLRLLLS